MSYLDVGFNENLIRQELLPDPSQQLDPLQFEQFAQEFSGSKLIGLLQSRDGKITIDLDNNTIIVSDGVVERVRLGKLADDSIGLLIKDINGNVLMQISGDTNIIQSSNKHMQLNFKDETLIVTDEGGTPVVLLGKQIGGF